MYRKLVKISQPYLRKEDLKPARRTRFARRAKRLQIFEIGDVVVVIGGEGIIFVAGRAVEGSHLMTVDPVSKCGQMLTICDQLKTHGLWHGCQMAIAKFLDCLVWPFGLLDYGSATLRFKI